MYSALDLGKYIVDYCYKRLKPINNLKLQLMLYLIWIDYYNECNNLLFNEKFQVFQFGPVVPEVYSEFCTYGGINICSNFENVIKEKSINDIENIIMINGLIDKYIDASGYDLVSIVTSKNSAWYNVYNNGSGLKKQIPFHLIRKLNKHIEE